MEAAVIGSNRESALELLPEHVSHTFPDVKFALLELEAGLLQSRGDVAGALEFASERLVPLAVEDRSLAPGVEDSMVSLLFPGDGAPAVCFTPSARRASALTTDCAARAVQAKAAHLKAAGYPAPAVSCTPCRPGSRAVDGLDPSRLRESVLRHLREPGGTSSTPPNCVDGQRMLSSRRRVLTAEQLRAAWLRRGEPATGSRLELLLGALRAAELRLQEEFGVHFPALAPTVGRGGLPSGDWAEAERCAQAEVDASEVLAAYASGVLPNPPA